jgi:hypothetical protein
MPSSAVYRFRFNGLIRAYKLIGYTPDRDYSYIRINQFLRKMHKTSVDEAINQIQQLGGKIQRDEKTDLLRINSEFTVSIVVGRCWQTRAGSMRWLIRIETGLNPDITVALRMDSVNQTPLDYYLLPSIDLESEKLRLAEDNAVSLDTYRFFDLSFFFGMAERVKMRWQYER